MVCIGIRALKGANSRKGSFATAGLDNYGLPWLENPTDSTFGGRGGEVGR